MLHDLKHSFGIRIEVVEKVIWRKKLHKEDQTAAVVSYQDYIGAFQKQPPLTHRHN